jgi:hypothetical protein
MKKLINLNFILRKFFDPKLITLSIFLSLIISTASIFLQEKLQVFTIDIFFTNKIKKNVYLDELDKLKLNKDNKLTIKDMMKLQYLKDFSLSNEQLFLDIKMNLLSNDLKRIENKLNGKIKLNKDKYLNNSNNLSFEFIKNLDYYNQENNYDVITSKLYDDTKVIFNQYINEYLKKKEISQDYFNEKDFVIVFISLIKEYKFNFFRLFSTFIFISLFINLIFVLFKFRKNILT